MKVQVYTTSVQYTDHTSLDQAFNHVIRQDLKRYMFLLQDDTGLSLYDSLRGQWLFPQSEQVANLLISLELE